MGLSDFCVAVTNPCLFTACDWLIVSEAPQISQVCSVSYAELATLSDPGEISTVSPFQYTALHLLYGLPWYLDRFLLPAAL